jgi:uncharacterized protein (TIGR00369 family)
MTAPAMTREEVEAFLDREFPQLLLDGRVFVVEEVGPMAATMRLRTGDRHLRPGGTVSGPSLMTLADLVFYVAILGSIGPVTRVVTANLSFNFLRRPEPRDVIAECRLFRLGRRLAVGEAKLFSEGQPEMVCHATGSYAIPSDR